MTKTISTVMDKRFLDPLIGFVLPGAGDVLSSVLILPFLHVSIFQVRSLPLTLAIIYNELKDSLVGLVPLFGDFLDLLYRANSKNYSLIVGFVEEDPKIIREVNRKAAWTGVAIAILCVLLYFAIRLMVKISVATSEATSHFLHWVGL